MSALRTRLPLLDTAATASTARLTTAITSSQSPSMLANIALVSFGSPDSRTTLTAAATASPTLSLPPAGVTLKATITKSRLSHVRLSRAGPVKGMPDRRYATLGRSLCDWEVTDAAADDEATAHRDHRGWAG